MSHLNVNWHQVQKFERGLVDLGVLTAQISGIWSGLVRLDLGRFLTSHSGGTYVSSNFHSPEDPCRCCRENIRTHKPHCSRCDSCCEFCGIHCGLGASAVQPRFHPCSDHRSNVGGVAIRSCSRLASRCIEHGLVLDCWNLDASRLVRQRRLRYERQSWLAYRYRQHRRIPVWFCCRCGICRISR